jgi:hypothetical protein
MKNLIKKAGVVIGGAYASVMVVAGNAAALDFTGITLDTTDVDSAMALVIVGLATLWGYRKVIKTMNRS